MCIFENVNKRDDMIDEDGEEKITMRKNEIYRRPIETHICGNRESYVLYTRKIYVFKCKCIYLYMCLYT